MKTLLYMVKFVPSKLRLYTNLIEIQIQQKFRIDSNDEVTRRRERLKSTYDFIALAFDGYNFLVGLLPFSVTILLYGGVGGLVLKSDLQSVPGK